MTRLLKLLLVLPAFVVLLSSISWADTKGVDSTYIPWDRYIAYSNPGTDTLGPPTWQTMWVSDSSTGVLPQPINIVGGNTIWLGIYNGYRPKNVKILTVKLEGTGLTNLDLAGQDTLSIYGVIRTPRTRIPGLCHETIPHSATQYIMRFEFDPQPDWEVFKFTAKGAVTITRIYVVFDCNPRGVPALTEYGLAVLVLLIIAATAFVVYRRRHRVIA